MLNDNSSDGPGGFFSTAIILPEDLRSDGLPFAALVIIDPVDYQNVTLSGDSGTFGISNVTVPTFQISLTNQNIHWRTNRID